MSNNMRWRYGETNPVMMTALAGTVIEIGDLLYLDGDEVKPASMMKSQGILGATRRAFSDRFAGVAMQAALGVEAADIRVATSGVFEFSCPTSTFRVGEMTCILSIHVNQRVAATQLDSRVIGVCVKGTEEEESVLIEIKANESEEMTDPNLAACQAEHDAAMPEDDYKLESLVDAVRYLILCELSRSKVDSVAFDFANDITVEALSSDCHQMIVTFGIVTVATYCADCSPRGHVDSFYNNLSNAILCHGA